MSDIDFIFTDQQYKQLKQEYEKLLSPKPNAIISTLNCLIWFLQHTSFKLKIKTQNIILKNLSKARQILDIVYTSKCAPLPNLTNSPFNLIYCLTNLSSQLTSHSTKSAYQILLLKSNSFILQSIKLVCENFLDENDKIFRF